MMEAGVERAFGHELHLSGPLMDMYFERIGRCILKKLGQKHLTGATKPFKEFIPCPIFKNMVRLFSVYGCDVHHIYPKNKAGVKKKKKINEEPKKTIIFMEKVSSYKKIFAPERFDGTNFLAKRMFAMKLKPGTRKRELVYDGKAVVAITTETPLRFDYDCKQSILSVMFVIQRYSADGIAVDSSVQAQVNVSAVPE